MLANYTDYKAPELTTAAEICKTSMVSLKEYIFLIVLLKPKIKKQFTTRFGNEQLYPNPSHPPQKNTHT